MKLSTSLLQLFLVGASGVSAAPHAKREAEKAPSKFYLVTTSSPKCASNSSLLPDVSATSVFAPFQQDTYLLRTQGPGYLQLPVFILEGTKNTSKSLISFQPDVLGHGNYTYINEPVRANSMLQLAQSGQHEPLGGGLSLVGCALAVNGSISGWTLCTGALSQTIVSSIVDMTVMSPWKSLTIV